MQLLVLRPDYHSSSELEKLQKQLYLSSSKRALQPPHIPLLAYKNTSPLQSSSLCQLSIVLSFQQMTSVFPKQKVDFIYW